MLSLSFSRIGVLGALTASVALSGCSPKTAASGGANTLKLLNVSYDPTREFYQDFNRAFIAHWKATKNQDVSVEQSHGGSATKARKVLDGQEADVVTLALAYDIDTLADGKLLPQNWQTLLPHNSAPYTSTIVFLVKKGNPKNIKDWNDLIKPGVQVVTPNPKTSGGARWNYLAAYGYALHQPGGNDAKATDFIKTLYNDHTDGLDAGARGATNTFVKNGVGDVLISWENEALQATKGSANTGSQFEIVTPSESILAEPPVAVVDSVAKKHGTEELAKAYLQYLYSPEGQEIAAKRFYRPRDPKVAAKYAAGFPKVKLWTLQSTFGDWRRAQKTHFDSGGVFDQFYSAK
jgi:sulfate/thiosulfate-binding protein